MDRFDEMRAKGINTSDATATASDISQGKTAYVAGKKITGTMKPSSGSSNFNVYMQNNEPSSKDGIWVKGNKSSAGVKFFDYATATGEFLEASKFDFLRTTEDTIVQHIVEGVMYVIARSSSGSYKINLETKVKTSINTPNFSYSGWLDIMGSCVYNGKIYVFGYSTSRVFCYYVYDIATDTTETPITKISDDTFGSCGYGCYEYSGKVLVCGGGYNTFKYVVVDLETKKVIKSASLSCYGAWQITGYGTVAYTTIGLMNGIYQLYKFNFEDYSMRVITNLGTDMGQFVPYAALNNLYLFKVASGANTYYKYDLTTGEMQTLTASNVYYLATNYYYYISGSTSHFNSLMLDDKTGILYFRTGKGEMQVSGMQLTPSPSTSNLSDGTIAIIQSQYKNLIKIQNDSNIHTGVENVFVKNSDGLESVETYLGDGTSWRLFKSIDSEAT